LTPTPDNPDTLLALVDPSADALLDVLWRRVDDALLREIAAADYGQETDKHLRELLAIRDNGAVPAPQDWYPKEVLDLTRWSEPSGPQEKRRHLKRVFACAVLLRAAAEPANADGNFFCEADTLAHLLDSALVLGDEVQRATLRFLAWRVQELAAREPDRAFFALAVALLAVRLRGGPISEDWLGRLGWWVLGQAEQDGPGSPMFVYAGLKYGAWQALARRMREEVDSLPPGETRDVLEAMAGLIVV
jgi:hypothetical protein